MVEEVMRYLSKDGNEYETWEEARRRDVYLKYDVMYGEGECYIYRPLCSSTDKVDFIRLFNWVIKNKEFIQGILNEPLTKEEMGKDKDKEEDKAGNTKGMDEHIYNALARFYVGMAPGNQTEPRFRSAEYLHQYLRDINFGESREE